MRWFDAIGIGIVATWIAFTGAYVYHRETETDEPSTSPNTSAALEEGTDRLVLRRDGRDVGFVNEERTRLPAGWLVEYEAALMVEVFGDDVPIEGTLRAELDSDAFLREFDADIRAADTSVAARGTVESEQLSISLRIDDDSHRRTIDLGRRPRLQTSAVRELMGRTSLQAGDRIEQTYFAPTRLATRKVAVEYLGRTRTDLPTGERRVHYLRQTFGGSSYDVFADDDGRILKQEFPLELEAVRPPPEEAERRSETVRDAIDEARRTFTAGERTRRGMRTLVRLLGFRESARAPDRAPSSTDSGRPNSSTSADGGTP